MDHLDVMPGAVFPNVSRARHAAFDRVSRLGGFNRLAGLGIDLGGDRIPDRLQIFSFVGITPGHGGGTEARTSFSAGDSGTKEPAPVRKFFFTPDCVGPLTVTTVHDEIVL